MRLTDVALLLLGHTFHPALGEIAKAIFALAEHYGQVEEADWDAWASAWEAAGKRFAGSAAVAHWDRTGSPLNHHREALPHLLGRLKTPLPERLSVAPVAEERLPLLRAAQELLPMVRGSGTLGRALLLIYTLGVRLDGLAGAHEEEVALYQQTVERRLLTHTEVGLGADTVIAVYGFGRFAAVRAGA